MDLEKKSRNGKRRATPEKAGNGLASNLPKSAKQSAPPKITKFGSGKKSKKPIPITAKRTLSRMILSTLPVLSAEHLSPALGVATKGNASLKSQRSVKRCDDSSHTERPAGHRRSV